MNPPDILTAKDPDLRGSYAAMRRAAMLARKVAIQTDTGIVIVKDGQLTFVDAKTLREQAEAQNASTT